MRLLYLRTFERELNTLNENAAIENHVFVVKQVALQLCLIDMLILHT